MIPILITLLTYLPYIIIAYFTCQILTRFTSPVDKIIKKEEFSNEEYETPPPMLNKQYKNSNIQLIEYPTPSDAEVNKRFLKLKGKRANEENDIKTLRADIDINNDGIVSPNELRTALTTSKKSKLGLTDIAANTMLSALDNTDWNSKTQADKRTTRDDITIRDMNRKALFYLAAAKEIETGVTIFLDSEIESAKSNNDDEFVKILTLAKDVYNVVNKANELANKDETRNNVEVIEEIMNNKDAGFDSAGENREYIQSQVKDMIDNITSVSLTQVLEMAKEEAMKQLPDSLETGNDGSGNKTPFSNNLSYGAFGAPYGGLEVTTVAPYGGLEVTSGAPFFQ